MISDTAFHQVTYKVYAKSSVKPWEQTYTKEKFIKIKIFINTEITQIYIYKKNQVWES